MGDGSEGDDEDTSNGAGTGDDVQVDGSEGNTLREREIGSYGVDNEGYRGVPPSGGSEDIRDFISESRGGGMGVVISGRGLGGGGDVAIEGVNSEETGYHFVTYLEYPHL